MSLIEAVIGRLKEGTGEGVEEAEIGVQAERGREATGKSHGSYREVERKVANVAKLVRKRRLAARSPAPRSRFNP